MGLREHETDVSPTEGTIPDGPERALTAPRFDEKSVQGARPAVPLTRRGVAHSSSLAVILLCVAAGLLGGMVVAVALTLFQKDSGPLPGETAARQQAGGPAVGAAASPETPAATAAPSRGGEGNAPGPQDDGQGRGARAPDARAETMDVARAPAPAGAVRDSASVVAASAGQTSPRSGDGAGSQGEAAEAAAGARDELRAALGEWVAATNARDVGRQMAFYAPTLGAYYLTRDTPREAVRAEKSRVFGRAESVDVQASAPDIRVSGDGQMAVMRFRKRYRITGGAGERSGEVLQELRWRRTPGGWKIVSERDLRVLE